MPVKNDNFEFGGRVQAPVVICVTDPVRSSLPQPTTLPRIAELIERNTTPYMS